MKFIKSNMGFSMADIIIALLILTMFTGVIGSLIYQVAYNNACIRLNAVATEYAIKVAEDIDKRAYDEIVTQELVSEINGEKVLDEFKISVKVIQYNEDDTAKDDIIKKVTITVKYSILQDEKIYEIQKLKIKEI